MQREVQALEAEVRAGELANSLVENEWGSLVDRREYLSDTPGFGTGAPGLSISLPQDRRNGDNRPFWQTEQEHATTRGIARFVAGTDGIGIAALNNLCNYITGEGFTFEFSPREEYKNAPEAIELAKRCNVVLERFIESNQFHGDGDRHGVERAHRDGELTGVLYHHGGLDVELRFACPSNCTEPDDKGTLERFLGLESLEWKYGVAADWGNPCRVHGYFMLWEGDRNDWEFVEPARMLHVKLNVDREIKRGLSDYYHIYRDLEAASKLLSNSVRGGAIQAAIAYIREHSPGVGARRIRDFAGASADKVSSEQRLVGGRSQDRRTKRAEPGLVIDTPSGTKYHAGPMGQQRSMAYIELLQAAYRTIGARWNMPEYMISGDASNGSFASTLVAESPFVVGTKNRQAIFKRHYGGMAWKVVGLVHRYTSFVPLPVDRIKQYISLTVSAPDLSVRDRLKENQASKIEADAGLLSDETWASRSGLVLADERAKGAKKAPMFSPKDQVDAEGKPIALPAPAELPVEERVSLINSLIWGNYP